MLSKLVLVVQSESTSQRTRWCVVGDQIKKMHKTYGCPVELSLALVCGKWKSVILARLKDHHLTHEEPGRLIPNLSDK
jgi:hypothetical protein